MKIALFGASGMIGSRILDEALRRGHEVTAVVRDTSRVTPRAGVVAVAADALDPAAVEQVVRGHDAVVSAISPAGGDPRSVVTAANVLIESLPKAGVKRLLVVGGAGSLVGRDGTQIVDAPDFPQAWRAPALAHRDALQVYRGDATRAGLDWTYFSPAAEINPGMRTGQFRLGTDELVVNTQGRSRISAEDYAVAALDELERPQFSRGRFTAAY